MDLILSEFKEDLATITRQLDLMDEIKQLSAAPELASKYRRTTSNTEGKSAQSLDFRKFLGQSDLVQLKARESHTGFPVVCGTMALYISGRFEEFTRTSFEDLCQKLAQRASSFKSLPKKMQDNLIIHTAIVMQNPRKYQHGEGAVASFAENLAANLSANSSVERINYQCLSITEANMKPDILAELYERIGVKEIWKKIGQQALILAYLTTQDPGAAETQAKQKLTTLMDLRNSIAHPSTSIVWPASEVVRDYIKFLEVLATALSSLSVVFEGTLCRVD